MKISAINIKGYKPFRDFTANLGALEVIVGANGSGKSSLFEFLKFLRDGMQQDIPPEIVAGAVGQQVFHVPGPERFQWQLDFDDQAQLPLIYLGELMGPIGKAKVVRESVTSPQPSDSLLSAFVLLDVENSIVELIDGSNLPRQIYVPARRNQLALSTVNNPENELLFNLREFIRQWRFYSAFNIANEKIRKSVPLEQEPALREDAGNLSSVLHYLMTEHGSAFDELQQHLRSVVPGFRSLTVKARGGPGEVIAFWSEKGLDRELSLADLSDGSLRLLCWMTLCLLPNPPTLLCIDEPDQGVHPRTLPVLAGLFKKASSRTQILLATHASYFLTQFDIDDLAIIRKLDGAAAFVKPGDSKILRANLDDFGIEEIEAMHRSDELEVLA